MKATSVILLAVVIIAASLGHADAYACNNCACLDASRTEHCIYGACRMSRDGTAICVCDDGYRGNRCQYPIQPAVIPIVADPCDSNPCQNNGFCSSANGAYSCWCLSRFSGTNCQNVDSSSNDVCAGNVCAANERCVPWNLGNNYWCVPQ